MRAIWTGSLSFGLVNIPVRLYSATAGTGLSFKLLDRQGLAPVHYVKTGHEGREVPSEDIVKGFEYRRGDYVIMEEEDFEKANARRTKTVDIVDFVPEDEIDRVFFEKPYYLEPDKGADKPYALLREALERSGKVGIAEFVLRQRSHLAAVKPSGQVLVLEQMRFASELNDPGELKLPDAAADERELKMALALIDQLSEPFQPDKFRDTYTEELEKVIEAKVKGQPIKAAGKPPRPTEANDIMAALKASLEQARG